MRTYILQPVEITTTKTQLLVGKSFFKSDPNHPLRITVANMAISTISVYKNMKLAELTKRPTSLVDIMDNSPTETANYAKEIDYVNLVPLYKEKPI